MHHGPDRFDEKDESEILRSLRGDVEELDETDFSEFIPGGEKPDLGATGRYPEGKLREDDEGEITIGITVYEGKVIMDLGGDMGWVGFTPEQSRHIASTLQRRAKQAEQQAG
jgi:hypothetical protein